MNDKKTIKSWWDLLIEWQEDIIESWWDLLIEWQEDIIELQTDIIEWQADIIESAQWIVFLIWKLLHTIAASCDRRLHRVSCPNM